MTDLVFLCSLKQVLEDTEVKEMLERKAEEHSV